MAHHLYATFGSGNCFKALLIGAQLDLDYKVHWVDVLKGEQKSDDYLAINPNGTVPYLMTEEGVGLGESNAILWYLAAGSDLFPDSPIAQAETVQWMVYEQTKLEPFISPARFFTSLVPERAVDMADQISQWQNRARAGMTHLDVHLSQHDFMVGEHYSIADIAIFGYVHVADEAGLDMTQYSAVCRWIDRVEDQKKYQPILSFKPET